MPKLGDLIFYLRSILTYFVKQLVLKLWLLSGRDKKVISNVPHLYSDSLGPAKASTSQLQVSGKGSTGACQKVNLGASFGQIDSEEDIEDVSSEVLDEG